MANFCVKPEIKKCSWRFSGLIIGTTKLLCNCYSKNKPCETEDDLMIKDLGMIPMEFPKHGDVDIEKDFKEFFGKSCEEVLAPYYESGDENKLKRKLFAELKEITRSSVREIYEKTDHFTIHTSWISQNWFQKFKDQAVEAEKDINKMHESYQLAIEKFPNNKKEIKILDYGCGPAIYSLPLVFAGFDVTLADLDTPLFRFLQFLCQKYRVGVDFFTCTDNTFNLGGEYDYIICTDVLEHVDEPEEMIDALRQRLKVGGWMYLTTFFDDCHGNDPSHLRKNTERYGDSEKWLGKLVHRGLVPLFWDKNGVEKGYQRLK